MNDDMEATGVSTATKQAVNGRDENGRFVAGNMPSEGFHTHPERRHNGKWDKDESISYWYNKLGRMSDEEFEGFKPYNQNQRIALSKIQAALGSDELALRCTKEITDRTEGRPQQGIDMNIEQDNTEHIIKGFVIPTLPEDFIEKDIRAQLGEEEAARILNAKA